MQTLLMKIKTVPPIRLYITKTEIINEINSKEYRYSQQQIQQHVAGNIPDLLIIHILHSQVTTHYKN